MKKVFAVILCMFIMMSSVCAYAALPGQLMKMPLNYSGDMTFEASMENADELVDFILSLEEDAGYDSGIFDLRTFITSIFDISGKTSIQGNISKDYRKMQVYIGAEATYNANLNQNLDIKITPRGGVWIDMDISNDENPVLDIILLTPRSSKYFELNVFEVISDDEKSEVLSVLGGIFNAEVIEGLVENSMSILEKYATIKTKGSECTITLDNDSTIALYAELFKNAGEIFGKFMPDEIEYNPFEKLPDFDGIKILGEDGIKIKYILGRDGIEREICDIDIDFNFSSLYTLVSGYEWEYEDDMNIKFNISSDSKYYDYGGTVVEMPVLTAENSVNVTEGILEGSVYLPFVGYPGYYDYTYEEPYPRDWLVLTPSYIPVIDSKIYLPFRDTLYAVYGDTTVITNDNGVITAVCRDSDKDITICVAQGSNVAYLDGVEYAIGGVVVIDGVEYVDIELFNTVMGWSIDYAEYNVLTGKYQLSGGTYTYDYYEYESIYPSWYTSAQCENLPFIEGQVYLPLRALLEDAYGDSLTLEYDNGKITAYSEYFPGFESLVLNVGDGKVYADSRVLETGACFTENGTTFVHPEIFTEIFGWELDGLSKDLFTGVYSFSYTTH